MTQNLSATVANDVQIVYDHVELPPWESRREATSKLILAICDIVKVIADARVEFVYMTEHERELMARSIINAMMK